MVNPSESDDVAVVDNGTGQREGISCNGVRDAQREVLASFDDYSVARVCSEDKEEELIMQLFMPRTNSIGSESELEAFVLDDTQLESDISIAGLCLLEKDESDENDIVLCEQFFDDNHSTSASITSSDVNSTASLRNTERQLKGAEKAFLVSGQKQVRSRNIPLETIFQRFSQTTVPVNPLKDENYVDNYMNKFVKSTVEDAVNTASPSMIGHMTSSLPYFMRPLSRLVTTMNQNVVKTETANTVTFMEREALAQLHEKIYGREPSFYIKFTQDSRTALGVFSSGGTLANVTALWAARNVALQADTSDNHGHSGFLGVEREGLFAALNHYGFTGGAVLIGSELLHYSMAKAADVLGIGVKALVGIPFDVKFQVCTDLVRAALEDCKRRKVLVVAVLGIAGTTETGSVDDLQTLAALSREFGTHFHVDAAWGGPLVFSRRHKHLLKGIEQADSVTLDGHKQLYMPMGCGLCFFRDPKTSLAVRKTASYIIRKDSYDLGKFTFEGSRPANAVYLHSNLNILGVRGYEILVDRSIRMVQHMVSCINDSNNWFQLIVNPMSNILLYRCLPPWLRLLSEEDITPEDNKEADALNIELQRLQTLQGRTFVSRTTVKSPVYGVPIVALRVVIANPLTSETDIGRVLRNQVSILSAMIGADIPEMPKALRPQDKQELRDLIAMKKMFSHSKQAMDGEG